VEVEAESTDMMVWPEILDADLPGLARQEDDVQTRFPCHCMENRKFVEKEFPLVT
jgi:hypothetical protein